jgi:CRISPR/Cas system-associated exonuclease Cas4 (RecB family)
MRLSFSSWSTYHQCPFKYKAKNILGIREEFSGPAAERGTGIHNMIEEYIRQNSHKLPWDEEDGVAKVPKLGHKHPLHPVVNHFRDWPNGDRHAERKFFFDIDWSPYCTKENAAFTVVFDVAARKDNIVEIGEWKSGKPYDGHAEQRLMYALAGLAIWMPEKVIVTTYYVDMTSDAKRLTVTPDDLEDLKEIWNSRRETIMNDNIMAPRPNDKCRYCYLRKSAGGICALDY